MEHANIISVSMLLLFAYIEEHQTKDSIIIINYIRLIEIKELLKYNLNYKEKSVIN